MLARTRGPASVNIFPTDRNSPHLLVWAAPGGQGIVDEANASLNRPAEGLHSPGTGCMGLCQNKAPTSEAAFTSRSSRAYLILRLGL